MNGSVARRASVEDAINMARQGGRSTPRPLSKRRPPASLLPNRTSRPFFAQRKQPNPRKTTRAEDSVVSLVSMITLQGSQIGPIADCHPSCRSNLLEPAKSLEKARTSIHRRTKNNGLQRMTCSLFQANSGYFSLFQAAREIFFLKYAGLSWRSSLLPGQRDTRQKLAGDLGCRPGGSEERCPPCRANLSRRGNGCEGGSSKSVGGSGLCPGEQHRRRSKGPPCVSTIPLSGQ